MKDLAFIEEHLKTKKYNNPHFFISLNVMLDGKIEYWTRFSMMDDENDQYTDSVQVVGDSPEEVTHKIVEYLKSGNHYEDNRYL